MTRCTTYRPDHNGECLNCDEWYDAHVEAVDETSVPPAAEPLASRHFAAEVVAEAGCRACGHLARHHVPGRCRKHRCGCGGWA